MRSHEERVAETKQRIAARQRKELFIRKMLRRLWGLLLIGENCRSERLVELLLKNLLI